MTKTIKVHKKHKLFHTHTTDQSEILPYWQITLLYIGDFSFRSKSENQVDISQNSIT